MFRVGINNSSVLALRVSVFHYVSCRNQQQFGFGLTGLALSKPNGLAKPIKLEPAWQLILAQIGSVQLEQSQTELNPVKAAQA